jgi:hypothetical protein
LEGGCALPEGGGLVTADIHQPFAAKIDTVRLTPKTLHPVLLVWADCVAESDPFAEECLRWCVAEGKRPWRASYGLCYWGYSRVRVERAEHHNLPLDLYRAVDPIGGGVISVNGLPRFVSGGCGKGEAFTVVVGAWGRLRLEGWGGPKRPLPERA